MTKENVKQIYSCTEFEILYLPKTATLHRLHEIISCLSYKSDALITYKPLAWIISEDCNYIYEVLHVNYTEYENSK